MEAPTGGGVETTEGIMLPEHPWGIHEYMVGVPELF